MQIKNLHKDIERYLTEDCYCKNIIYSFDGFWYKIFEPDTECELLGQANNLIICLEKKSTCDNQVLVFFEDKNDKDTIIDSVRFDATENNLKIVKEHLLVDSPLQRYSFDEFHEGQSDKELQEILALCNGIFII